MSEKTILVIDDSATIRRLVDNELGADGYRVIMAATAEEGLATAAEELPDLILLDHQLPGITGYEVCCQLIESPQTCRIPVVCSSTLRKKAYAEYTELDNVVDMLPKPYTPDLLRTIVANALETASLIVDSQSGGTAVPEVIDELAEGDLSGNFRCFGLREVLDFLNNGRKSGQLEIDLGRSRVAVHLSAGRIQAVTGSGIDTALVADALPQAIADLAPMVKFTMRGKNCNEIDGLVELLDNKVLDARLLKQLLRHQAALLLDYCLKNSPRSFRFDSRAQSPVLFAKLPLDISLLALMVDAALASGDSSPQPEQLEQMAFVKSPQRGQNLDRAGLAASHMQLLNALSAPVTAAELATRSSLDAMEIYCVLQGLANAEVVTRQEKQNTLTVFAVTGDAEHARRLTDFFSNEADSVSGRVVRDLLAIKLMLRRVRPDALLLDFDCQQASEVARQLCESCPEELEGVRWLGVASGLQEAPDWAARRLTNFREWPESDGDLHGLLSSQESNEQPAAVVAAVDFS